MASTDVVMISLSPLKQFQSHSLTMSSSPLPSPSEIGKKKEPILRKGADAASIPLGSFVNFTTTSSTPNLDPFRLPTRSPAEDCESATKTKSKVKHIVKPRPKKVVEKKDSVNDEKPIKPPRKTAGKKTEGPKELGEKKPRKPRAKKIDSDNPSDEPVKEKLAKKPRVKKADGDTQTKLPKAQVTKSSGQPKSGNNEEKEESVEADCIDYGLVKAVKRMADWSSTATSSKYHLASTELTDIDVVSPEPGISNGFNNLLGNFGFTSSEATSATERKVSEGGVTRKRKLIELVKTNVATAAAASPKPKAPKNKARTITGLAISAFEGEVEEEVQTAPLLQYLTDQKDGKPRSRNPVKIPTAKKGSALAPILLSPESAMKQVSNQDFVFGTSSQLAREESPTYLRDLHEAMQASNHSLDDPFDDPFDDPLKDVVSNSSAIALRGRLKKKGLWSIGARDATGSLLDVEMVDLVDTPVALRVKSAAHVKSASRNIALSPEIENLDFLETPAVVRGIFAKQGTASVPRVEVVDMVDTPVAMRLQPSQEAVPNQELDDQWLDVEDLIAPAPKPPTATAAPSKELGHDEAKTRQQICSQETGAPLEAKLPGPPSSVQATKKKAAKDQMPDFEAYTVIQLERQLAKYHFKSVKARAAMISLLQRCWEEQHNKKALSSLDTNTMIAPSAKSPKKAIPPNQVDNIPKKRGRPPKASTATSPAKPKRKHFRPKKSDTVEFEDSDASLSKISASRKSPKKLAKKPKLQPPEEIYDSDPPIPSPPRRCSSKTTAPLPLPLKSTLSASSSQESDDQESLFKHITRAIKSTVPTKDPRKPTWYEKILLYDPIVLQDLTGWLNVEGLGKVAWDREVNILEVKKWCQGRGICCISKENLTDRAKY